MTPMEYELLCSAHHLAARAVFVWRHRGSIGKRGIYLNPDGSGEVDSPDCWVRSTSSAAYVNPDQYKPFWSDRAERKTREVIAGTLAQRRFRKHRDRPGTWSWFPCGGSDNDFPDTLAILRAWVAADKIQSGPIDLREVRLDFIRNSVMRTQRDPKVWGAVQAVANALVENGGHLDGDTAFRLIEAKHAPRPRLDGFERIGDASRE
jgi:hypothetical protein